MVDKSGSDKIKGITVRHGDHSRPPAWVATQARIDSIADDADMRYNQAMGRDRVATRKFLELVLQEGIFYKGSDDTEMVRIGNKIRNGQIGNCHMMATLRALGLNPIGIKSDQEAVFGAKKFAYICDTLGLSIKADLQLLSTAYREEISSTRSGPPRK